MVARPVLGDDLLRVGRDQLDLDPRLAHRRLDRLRDVHERRRVGVVELDREAVRHAGIGEELLGLRDVEPEGRVGQGGEESARPERLVDFELAAKECVRHPLIIDQPADRLADLGLLEVLVLLVEPQVVEVRFRVGADDDVRAVPERGQLVRRDVPGHVDVALLELEPLRRRLGDVPHHHAPDLRWAVPVSRERVHHDRVVRLPLAEAERPGAGRVGLEPGVAEVPILLVVLDLLHVHDGADARREAVQHEGRCEVLGDGRLERRVVHRPNQIADVVLGPAKLAQDERRRLVELDHPLERVGRVPGSDRVPGVEPEPSLNLESEGPAVVGHVPTLGDAAHQPGRVLGLVHHDPVVEVCDHLTA